MFERDSQRGAGRQPGGAVTGDGRQQLRASGSLEEEQVSSEGDRMVEHAAVEPQQHRHASLYGTRSLEPGALDGELHLTQAPLKGLEVGFVYLKRKGQSRHALTVVSYSH